MSEHTPELAQLQVDLDEALRTGESTAIITATERTLRYHQQRNEYQECINYSKSLIPHLMKLGLLGKMAQNYSYMGKYYSALDDFDEAEEVLLNALQIYQDSNVELGIAEVESNLGIVFRRRGVFDISLAHLAKSLEIYRNNLELMETLANPQAWASYIEALECCGVIYGQLHQYEKSIQFLEDVLAVKEKHGGPFGTVSALMNLGVTYSEFDLDKAQEYYLKAFSEVSEHTPVYLRVVLLNNLGGVLEDLGKNDEALQYYQQALNLMDKSVQLHYQAPIQKHIGTIYFKQGRFAEALVEIQSSLDTSAKIGEKSEIKDCYLLLCDIYIAQNDYKTAMDYRVKYDALKDEVFQQDLGAQLSNLQKQYVKTSQNVSSLRYEKSLITEELKKAMNTGFVGVSESIKNVQKLAVEAAIHKDTRVLITGESGVGKEIVARLIHYSDANNKGRFIDVNGCSIPDTLAESEFFGYIKGAFTGAEINKPGYFEDANYGTLFLDEIGDMPMNLQSKLLRVLETKTVKRLGSSQPIPIEFRLITATNKDIELLVKENLFRVDLLYRINTIEIHIPPLRERQEDILPLLEYYLAEFAKKMNKSIPLYDSSVIQCLERYSFPGNVRELRNMIERAMIFLKSDTLRPIDFLSQMPDKPESEIQKCEEKSNLREMNDIALQKALIKHNGNQTQAAQELGISYSTFKRRYQKLRASK